MILSGGRRCRRPFCRGGRCGWGCCAAAAGFLLPPLAAGCFLAGSLLAGLFCAAGWVCFLGLILRGGLGLLLGLALRLALGGRSLLLLLGSGLLFLGGLGLAGLAALALLAVLGLGLRWLLLGSLGLAGFLAADFTGRSPAEAVPAAASSLRITRSISAAISAAVLVLGSLTEILPKTPSFFLRVLRQKPVHYSFFQSLVYLQFKFGFCFYFWVNV